MWNIGSSFASCAKPSAEKCVVLAFSLDDGFQCGNNVTLTLLPTSEASLP